MSTDLDKIFVSFSENFTTSYDSYLCLIILSSISGTDLEYNYTTKKYNFYVATNSPKFYAASSKHNIYMASFTFNYNFIYMETRFNSHHR